MGTELYEAGLEPDECGEAWNLSRPGRVLAVHRSYVEAGARCLLTNTFQANPCTLVRHDREDDLEAIAAAAVRLSRSAVGSGGFVLADVGPVLIAPEDSDFSDWSDLARTALAFPPGIDGILLETCSSPRALRAVEFLRRRVLEDDVPLLLSLAYLRRPDGALVTRSDHAPETFARHAESHGAAALGVNCGRDIDVDDAAEVVRRYRAAGCTLPLLARPNAGTPKRVDGRLEYPRSPADMAARLRPLLDAGAAMVGGCCGTTPRHIAAFRPVVDDWNQGERGAALAHPVPPR
jgi:5-methyltetrahydrofolate--homocysteine methyltransferase